MEVKFDSRSVVSNSYPVNTDIVLVNNNVPENRKICKNIVCLNTSAGTPTVLTLKLGNSIILTQTLEAGEYINYQAMIVVTDDNPLQFTSTTENVDVNVLMILEVSNSIII